MRLRRVLPALVLATALALVFAALAGAARPGIICPLATTCCPLPVAAPVEAGASPSGCCYAPGVLCPALPSIVSAPNPSAAGRSVTVSGLFPGAGSGTEVALWQKLAGQSGFHSMATDRANSSGHYAFALGKGLVQTNREWYATAAGQHTATLNERVAAHVTLTRALHVHVAPNHADERVWLEQREGSAWRVIARARLNRSSSAVMSAAVSANRPVMLRAVFPGDRRNVAANSGVVRL